MDLGFTMYKVLGRGWRRGLGGKDSGDEKEVAGREKGKRTKRCLWGLLFCKE